MICLADTYNNISSAYCNLLIAWVCCGGVGRSAVYMMYNNADKTPPCGTPAATGNCSDIVLFDLTEKVLDVIQCQINLHMCSGN